MNIRNMVSLLLVAAILTACGGSQPTAAPTAAVQSTPTAPPTARPQTQLTVQPTAGAKEQPSRQPTTPPLEPTRAAEDYDLSQATDLSRLDSYRCAYSWTWTETKDGATTTGFWEAREEFSKADAARHIFWTSNDGSAEMIQVGQYTYVNSSGEWTSMFSAAADPFSGSPFVSNPLVMVAEGRGKLVERGVTVNGVLADHYALVASVPGGSPGFGAAEKMQGDIFVAQQLEVAVQYVAHYEGKQLSISGGTNAVLDVTFDLTDINQPITIVAPEGVEPPLAEDIPILEGATGLSAMEGFASFKTTRSVEEVTAFYSQAMLEKGWTAGPVAADMLSFTKGTRQANIMIQAEEAQTAVIIMVGR